MGGFQIYSRDEFSVEFVVAGLDPREKPTARKVPDVASQAEPVHPPPTNPIRPFDTTFKGSFQGYAAGSTDRRGSKTLAPRKAWIDR